MSKLKSFIKSNRFLILILFLGFFLRTYKAQELFYYGHDQDLASWFVKNVIINKHLRLIGQETSTQGIFIGPIYYYTLIPFYLLFNMDPLGGVVMITILGIFSIWSFYHVFSKVFGKKEGLIAALVYATSFYFVLNDRDVVPTTPAITWTVWYFYALDLLLKGKQKKGFIILGILLGLIWHLNMALILLIPLIPISIYLSKKKVELKQMKLGMLYLIILSLPLIVFELRHNFSQSRAFITSLTTDQHAIVSGIDQFRRVILLMSKNIDGVFWGSLDFISYKVTLIVFVAIFIYLVGNKLINKNHAIILSIWIILYVSFFSLYSKNLSEYYLNGALLPWFLVAVVGISYLLSKKKLKIYGLTLILVFITANLHQFFTTPKDKSGYLYRKKIVHEIKENASEKNYPCISISYITKPGYEFGYRYFFYLENMHVNHPDSGSPVYTIVYPLRRDIEVNATYGHIGLIYPDFKRYNIEGVIESCSGENSNLTDPMWGMPY